MPQIPLPQIPRAGRLLIGIFGLVFTGAPLCMLALLWGDESDFVPIPARLFGSLICLAGVAFGGTMLFSAVTGGGLLGVPKINLPDPQATDSPAPSAGPTAGYVCPNCGAALGEKADVSPMGDVKCAFCGRWFNVHGRD